MGGSKRPEIGRGAGCGVARLPTRKRAAFAGRCGPDSDWRQAGREPASHAQLACFDGRPAGGPEGPKHAAPRSRFVAEGGNVTGDMAGLGGGMWPGSAGSRPQLRPADVPDPGARGGRGRR